MITTTLDTKGLDRLIADSGRAGELAVYAVNVEIARTARQLVRVRTGYTKSTIRIEDIPGGSEVIADGAALPLELGWHTRQGRQVGPFPFLLPAYNAHWPSISKHLADMLYLSMTAQGLPSKASLGK